MDAKVARVTVIAWAAAFSLPTGASAQVPASRGLVGLAVQSYAVRADAVDGSLPAVGLSGSVALNPFLDFEAELMRPTGRVSREHTGVLFSFAEPGATREEIERQGVVVRTTHERTVASVLSFGAAFHPRRTGSRFQPRLFTGITTHFARDRALHDPVSWPPTVTLDRVFRTIQPVADGRRAIGSLTLGAAVSIDLSQRLVLTPDVRYDYGSIGDEINNAWRVGTKLSWRY